MAIKALEWLRRTEVGSPTRKLVLYAIADRVKDGEWVTWAGQEALAQDTELSPRTVRTILRDLEQMGVIERAKRRRPDGYRTSDAIRLNVEWEPTSPAGDSPEAVSPEGDAGCSDQDIPAESHRQEFPGKEFPRKSTSTSPANERQSHRQELPRGDGKLELEVEPPTSRARSTGEARVIDMALRATDAGFERFWDVYPRHTGEKSARRAWYQAVGKATPDEIVEGALRYVRSGTFSEPRFAMDPSRWLFDERWRDDYRPRDDFAEWCNTEGNLSVSYAELGLEVVDGEIRPIGARDSA